MSDSKLILDDNSEKYSNTIICGNSIDILPQKLKEDNDTKLVRQIKRMLVQIQHIRF